jgi:MraZ protein
MSNESDIALGFYYEFEHGVDDKRRVQAPSRWKESLKAPHYVLVLWPHFDLGCQYIRVLPPEKHAELLSELQRASIGDAKGMALKRIIGRTTESVTIDTNRRFMLPKGMADGAGITDKVVLLGAVDTFEIWSPETYQALVKHEMLHAKELYGNFSNEVVK